MYYRLKITGNAKGFSVEVLNSTLRASGSIGQRMDGSTGLTWAGTFWLSGTEKAAYGDKLDAAIAEVMATGIEQTLVIGDQAQPEAVAAEWRSSRGLTLTEEMDEDDTDF